MAISLILLLIIFFPLSNCITSLNPNVTVDKSNAAGNYTDISSAINAAPSNAKYRYVIYIKKGVYNEQVNVPKEKPNITLVGDGKQHTIISSNNSVMLNKKEIAESGTLIIFGSGFLAINLTVRNVAGSVGEQAVAIRSKSPYSAFYGLSIEGYQDTLYVQDGPQFYRECDIYGTVDFIFGEGPATFQNCQIFARQSLKNKDNAITANGCMIGKNKPCGFSFHLCNIKAANDLLKSNSPTPTYLGRAWKNGSTTVFMRSHMTQLVNSSGWLPWENKNFEKTVFYGEFQNSGKGAFVGNRVNWPGVHSAMTIKAAESYTVSKFLRGEDWLPKLGVPFMGGLYK